MSGFSERMAEAGEMIFESGATQSVTYTHGTSESEITAVLRLTGDRIEPDEEQQTRKTSGEALVKQADVASVTIQDDTIEDESGRLWTVVEVMRDDGVFWRLRIEEVDGETLYGRKRTIKR